MSLKILTISGITLYRQTPFFQLFAPHKMEKTESVKKITAKSEETLYRQTPCFSLYAP